MYRNVLMLSTLAVPLLVVTTACNKADRTARTAEEGTRARTTETQPVNFAYVRFVDASARPVSLYFGNEKEFTGDSKSVSDYKRVPAERREFVRIGGRQ